MKKSDCKRGPSWAVLMGAGAGAITLLSVAPALAQDGVSVTDDVVVTATRREQALQDIPLAVSSYSGEALEDLGVTSLQDLAKVDATFAAQNYGAAFNQFIIRGVQSDIGSTVGMYLDEVPLTGGSATEGGGDGKPGLRLYDLARVEVLRGPQGTLFGSGSMSGTLRVITAQPEFDEFSGALAVSGASVNDGNPLYMGDGMLNIPIIQDKLALRVVGWGEQGGGYIDQTVPSGLQYDDVNDVDVRGMRAQLAFRPIDPLTITAGWVRQEIDVDGSQNWHLAEGPYRSLAQTVEPYSDQYDLYSLTATWDVPYGTFTGAVSKTEQENWRPEDTTPTANSFGVPFLTSLSNFQDYENQTAEIRFASDFEGPFQFVVGAYSEESTTTIETNALVADDTTGALECVDYRSCHAAGLEANVEFSTLDERDVEQYAIYAQGDYALTEAVTLTLGARYYSADITDRGITQQDVFAEDPICSTYYVYRGFGPPNLCGYAFGDVTVPYSRGESESSENETSYNASLLWEANDDLSFYARAASGFRIGGVNNSTLLAGSAGVDIPGTYEPDSLWSYELGTKAFFMQRRGFVDFSIYRIDWDQQQLNATDASGAFDFTLNAGATEINGAEIQVMFEPIDGLQLGAGLVYTDATLAEDLPANVGAIGFSGDKVPRVAELGGSARAEYAWSVLTSSEAYVQGALSYRDSSATAFNPSDPNYVEVDSYTLLDAALGLRHNEMDVRLFVNNLSDEAAQYAVDVSPDGQRVYSPRPRTIGVRVSTSF